VGRFITKSTGIFRWILLQIALDPNSSMTCVYFNEICAITDLQMLENAQERVRAKLRGMLSMWRAISSMASRPRHSITRSLSCEESPAMFATAHSASNNDIINKWILGACNFEFIYHDKKLCIESLCVLLILYIHIILPCFKLTIKSQRHEL